MKIKLSTIYASPQMSADAGTVIDVSNEEGAALIAARCGVEVGSPAPEAPAAPEVPAVVEETAAVEAPENASRRVGRGGRRRTE